MLEASKHQVEIQLKVKSLNGQASSLASIPPRIDDLAIAINADDLAVVRAFPAFHLARVELEIGNSLKIEAAACKSTFLRASIRTRIRGEQSRTVGTHQMPIRIHQHIHSKQTLESIHNPDVLRNAALEHHRRNDLFTLADVVEIVRCHRLAKARYDILSPVSDLDLVNQIGLREHRASCCNVGWLFRCERNLAELLDLNP